MADIENMEFEKNLRFVTAPLEIAQIKEFFENKELLFEVNYANSKIKGNMFLTYLANLDLPYEIDFEGTSSEEKFELIKHYMNTRIMNNSNSLKYATAQIILRSVGVEAEHVIQKRINFTIDECDLFIEKHKEIVEKWKTFLASTMLFMLTSVPAIEEEYNFKNQFKVIDDPMYIGLNIVNFIEMPFFMEAFYSAKCDTEVYYFKTQFEEYIFKGKNLFYYFANPDNMLFHVFNSLLSGKIEFGELKQLFSKAN